MKSAQRPEWISVRTAADLLGIRRSRMAGLVSRRAISVLQLPGSRPLVKASEVKRLAETAVQPAAGG